MAVAVTATPASVTGFEYASWVSSREGARTLLTVAGDVDFACAGAFAAALAVVAHAASDVVIDMSGVAFIDTAGLNAMVLAHRLFEILGLALVVRAPSHPVRRLLGVSRLDGLIEQPKTAVAQMFGPTRPAQQGLATRVMFGL
jgi:anti-anti-sigma factor